MYRYSNNSSATSYDPLGLFCTKDFVSHYWLDGRDPIDLQQVGLLTTFVNTPSVAGAMDSERNAMTEFGRNKARSLCEGCKKDIRYAVFDAPDSSVFVQTYRDSPCLYSLGSSMLNVSSTCWVRADCAARTFEIDCASRWSLRDRFTDPLSLYETFGTPVDFGWAYGINADWVNLFKNGSTF
jgi:hypothetical protein